MGPAASNGTLGNGALNGVHPNGAGGSDATATTGSRAMPTTLPPANEADVHAPSALRARRRGARVP